MRRELMFEVKTYVLKKGFRKNLTKEDFFLCTDERFLEYITDTQYIDGMIEVLYYGEEVMGAKEWDLVDQLWLYFVDAFIQLKRQKSVGFFFPDQLLEVKMTNLNRDVLLFQIGNKKYCFPRMIFIRVMAEEAKRFFSVLGYQNELDKIRLLLG